MQLLACSALRNGATKAWVTHLHCTGLLDKGEFRLWFSWRELCRARVLQAGRWSAAHVGDDDGELEVSGLSKAALAFYPAGLYSVFCPCPGVCDDDPSVGILIPPCALYLLIPKGLFLYFS